MSGSRRSGPPSWPFEDRRTSYHGASPTSRRDREERDRRDRDEREREAIRYREGDRQNSRTFERPRSRSRSPPRRRAGESYRASTRPYDNNRDSSAASSMTNSPVSTTRSLLPTPKPNTNTLPPVLEAAAPTRPPQHQPSLPPPPPLPSVQPPTSDPLNQSPALEPIIHTLAQELSKASSLEVRHHTAKTAYDLRASEFNKSKAQHEKFPNVKLCQTEAKDLAEKKYQAIEMEMGQQQSKVDGLASEALEKVVSEAASRATSLKEKELREENQRTQMRCDSLEKALQELTETVKIQARYIQDIQNAKESKSEEEGRKETEVIDQLSKLTRSISASSKDIHNLQTELDSAKDAIAEVKSKSSQMPSIQSELARVKAASEKTSKLVTEQTSNLQLVTETLKTLDETIKSQGVETSKAIMTLTGDIMSLKMKPKLATPDPLSNETLMSYGGRIGSTESSLKKIEGQLAALQASQQQPIDLSGFEQKLEIIQKSGRDDVKTVEDRVRRLENSHQSTNTFKDEFEKAFSSDLNALQVRVGQVERFHEAVNEKPAVSKKDVQSVEGRLAHVEKLVNSIQTPRPSPVPSSTSMATSAMSGELLARVGKLENDFKSCNGDVDTLKTKVAVIISDVHDTVNKALEDEVHPEFAAMKADFKQYEGLVDLPARFEEFLAEDESRTKDINELKKNLEGVVTSKVIEHLRGDPTTVSSNHLEHRLQSIQAGFNDALTLTNNEVVGLQNSLGGLQATTGGLQNSLVGLTTAHNQLHGEVSALTNVSNNHETRINNVTTGNLASIILKQLKEHSPESHLITQLQVDLDTLRRQVQDLSRDTRNDSIAIASNTSSLEIAAKETNSIKEAITQRFVAVIDNATRLEQRLEEVQSELGNLKNNPDTDTKINKITANLAALKETGVNVFQAQLSELKVEMGTIKMNLPADLPSQLESLAKQIGAFADNQPTDLRARLASIESKLETVAGSPEKLSAIETELVTIKQQLIDSKKKQEQVSGLETELTAINRQLFDFKQKQEQLSGLESKVTSLSETLEAMKGHEDKITEMGGQVSKIQGQLLDAAENRKARPADIVSSNHVNGVNGNKSSPIQTPRSGSISGHQNRQSSIATATSDSTKARQNIPALDLKRQPTGSTASANGAKNRSVVEPPAKPRPSVDSNKARLSRSAATEGAKGRETPIISDVLAQNKKRKHNHTNSVNLPSSKPVNKKFKNNKGFVNDDDDEDMMIEDISTPTMKPVENDDDDVVFLRETKAKPPTEKAPRSRDKPIKQDYS